MFVFGKNNNHLIKNNYKNTFSLPQKIRLIQKQITKCACAYDFILCLTKDLHVYCYFQSALYQIKIPQNQTIIDLATQQNFVLFVSQKGQLYGTQFLPQKLVNGLLIPKKIKINIALSKNKSSQIKQVKIINSQVFLKLKNQTVLLMKRNDWIESKSFSEPQIIKACQNHNIQDIAGNSKYNFFLSEQGLIFKGQVNSVELKKVQIKQKVVKIACNQKDLLAIDGKGSVTTILFKENKKATLKQMSKISKKFTDLVVGQDNYFSIDQDGQGWVWGKNSCGQLGLSDYEPRGTLYPLVSLQRYYIKNIYVGIDYTCCVVDPFRVRQSVKISERSSTNQLFRDVGYILNKINPIQKQTIHQNNHIHQTEKQSNYKNGVINYTEQEYSSQGLFDTSQRNQKNKSNYHSKPSLNQKSFSKANQYLLNKNSNQEKLISATKSLKKITKKHSPYLNQSCKSKYCLSHKNESGRQHSQSVISKQNRKQKKKTFQVKTKKNQSFRHKSGIKNSNSQLKRVDYKTPNKLTQKSQTTPNKIINKRSSYQSYNYERENKIQKEKLDLIKHNYEIKLQDLEQRAYRLQLQLSNKVEQNKQLFQLVRQKNLVIDDITGKIQLLEQAIQQHQKTLTARDNQAQQSFLREKQYQLHIQNLQGQIQKMLQVLNNNQRNKQAELYKNQVQRLSIQIKQKIQGQKQYYRERIRSIQRKFQEQKNLYQIQIRNLQSLVKSYQNKEAHLINSMKEKHSHNQNLKNQKPTFIFKHETQNLRHQKQQSSFKNQPYMESPSFHTLQVKKKSNQSYQFDYEKNNHQFSTETLKQKDDIKEKGVLVQSNKMNCYVSPMNKSQNQYQNKKTNKNYDYFSANNEPLNKKDEAQVDNILTKINQNKYSISKSANKLFNLLQNQNN